jgi:hypothetical protein
MWVTKGEEKERAKITFAGDVASLANANGGVLVIGVTDKRKIVGIANDARTVENRLRFASEVIANHLEYERELVTFQQVVLPDSAGVDRICLVVIVKQACEAVEVKDGESHTYPVRRETGIARVSRYEVASPKTHMKSDNYDFLRSLSQFIREH